MALVIYRGPSAYDPSTTIRAVLTADSANVKTSSMAQLFILHDSVAPHVAQHSGDDAAVCGLCPLRPALGGGCYVVTLQGPLSTWRATANLPVAGAAVISALVRKAGSVRLGAYGDPAALPPYVIAHLRTSCMASCETEDQAERAHGYGWRTFRATSPGARNLPSEITCPAETRGALCKDCLLCRGDSLGARSITIPVHGFTKSSALRVVQ
jgi:hypothetical protein